MCVNKPNNNLDILYLSGMWLDVDLRIGTNKAYVIHAQNMLTSLGH